MITDTINNKHYVISQRAGKPHELPCRMYGNGAGYFEDAKWMKFEDEIINRVLNNFEISETHLSMADINYLVFRRVNEDVVKHMTERRDRFNHIMTVKNQKEIHTLESMYDI